MMNLCTPTIPPGGKLTDSVDLNVAFSSSQSAPKPSGTQKTGRSTYQPAVRPPRNPETTNNARPTSTTNTTTADKSEADRSIKTSIRNVKIDVSSVKDTGEARHRLPVEDSVHTFAASQSTTPFRNRGNDYVMITDALSDVRVK